MSARVWNATAAEVAATYPCDGVLERVDQRLLRAVTIDAALPIVFRWLCQLKIAPYSYDLVDNLGRRSPQQLVPGAENLAVGQRVMTIFRVVDFAVDDHLTIRWDSDRLRGKVVVTYQIRPRADGTRLVACIETTFPNGPATPLLKAVFPAGDLLMMRRQLLNLKRLAERDRG